MKVKVILETQELPNYHISFIILSNYAIFRKISSLSAWIIMTHTYTNFPVKYSWFAISADNQCNFGIVFPCYSLSKTILQRYTQMPKGDGTYIVAFLLWELAGEVRKPTQITMLVFW